MGLGDFLNLAPFDGCKRAFFLRLCKDGEQGEEEEQKIFSNHNLPDGLFTVVNIKNFPQ